jgi:hypothetical protein
MRRSASFLAGAAALAAAALAGCAHTREDDPDVEEIVGPEADGLDTDTLEALEQGFSSLRAGDHEAARAWLERANATFDDLALPRTPLEKAFASDARKPYRGRPHERVLAATVLAALDIERGRCDLALPALRNAAYLDARANAKEPSDAVLVHVLALRCLWQSGAGRADVERARAELRSALAVAGAPARLEALEALARADDLTLALDGHGPAVRAEGSMGERAVIVPPAAPAPAGVVAARAGRTKDGAVRIRLGAREAKDADGLLVWSSTHQATTVAGRPFEEVLLERAAFRGQALSRGRGLMDSGVQAALARGAPAKAVVAGGVLATAGAGLTALGLVTDARADVRFVSSLFERGVLVGNAQEASHVR